MMAMPVPVAPVVKQTLPIYLDYPGRIEVDPQHRPAGARRPAMSKPSPPHDGADVKTRRPALQDRPARSAGGARSGRGAGPARRRRRSTTPRPTYARGEELDKSGFVAKDAFDQRESAMRQAEAALAHRSRRGRGGAAQSELRRNPRAVRRPARAQSGGEGRARRHRPARRSTRSSQLDPIYVTFNPSEIRARRDRASARRRQGGGGDFAPATTRRDTKGELTFLDNVVDKATGTISARATIANPDFALLPGQYVRVRLHVKDEPDALMAPQAAIGSSQMGKYVYVVGAGDKAEMRL